MFLDFVQITRNAAPPKPFLVVQPFSAPSPLTEAVFGTVRVAYSDNYLYFHNRATGWHGEVRGEAVGLVVAAMNAQRPEVVQIRLAALGSPLGCDVSQSAVQGFYPSWHG